MWLVAAFVLFAGMSLWAALAGEGFLEADGATHYNYARFAVERPYLLLDVWGRPLVTGLHCVPAYFFGRIGVQVTSLVIALLCGWATYRIAVAQGYRHPVAAPIFLFAQPLVFLHSFAELTELPFALLIILAFWAYQQKQYFVMTVLVALSPVGRPEGFGFMLLAAFALICHRRWWWMLLLPVPLLVWSAAGYIHVRPPGPDGLPIAMPWYTWLIRNWPYAAESNYGKGPIWEYVAQLPAIVGPLLVPAALIGGWTLLFKDEKGEERSGSLHPSSFILQPLFFSDHRRRCDFIIAALPFGILLTHSLFWAMGKFSGGQLRYMLIVGPFWALVVARGYDLLVDRLNLKRPLFIAAAVAVAPLIVNKFYRFIPIDLSRDERIARRIVEQYRADPVLQAKYPKVTSPSPMVVYFLDVCLTDYDHVGLWWRDALQNPAPGQFLIYETILANYNSDERMLVSQQFLEDNGWVFLKEHAREYKYNQWCVWATYLSPQSIDGQPTVKP